MRLYHSRFYCVYNLIAICLLSAISFMSGCVSKGATQVYQPPSKAFRNYKILAVEITSQVDNVEEVLVQLENSIIGKIRDRHLFDSTYATSVSPEKKADLKLTVTVTNIRKVGSTTRLLLGAFAGQGSLQTNVELTDVRKRNLIARAKAEGKTSGGVAWAGTTPQAVERVAEQVADFVAKHH